jgi:uncharacterized protein YdhG (YjbR/CyaY superfamily)
MPSPTTIDEYLLGVPKEMRVLLTKLRYQIAAAAPEAVESISYKMPAFKYRGRTLVYFAAFKKHCSFFPASVVIIETYRTELKPFRTSKGTLQFTAKSPLPRSVVAKIVTARVREIDSAKKK